MIPKLEETYRLARDDSGFKTLVVRLSDGAVVCNVVCGFYQEREAFAERIVDSLNNHVGKVLWPVDDIADGRGPC